MPTFSIDSNSTDMGCYSGDTEAEALDKYAQDAGYADYADTVEQFGAGETVIEIDTDAICQAINDETGYLVFQDPYGNGIALVNNVSYGSWQELAQLVGKNCWDFKATEETE